MMIMGDSDYVSMMLKHHDMGIEMARREAENGERQEVKTLAQKILEGQEAEKKELQQLQSTLKPGSESKKDTATASGGHRSGTSGMSGGMHDMASMSEMQQKHHADMDKMKTATGPELDTLFLRSMSQHHQMAIDMTKETMPKLKNAGVKAFAEKTLRNQQAEIAQMNKLASSKEPAK